MVLAVTQANVRSILTRTTGYLESVSSHSAQPYRGCTFGRSLCGVGCYVQHNFFLTRGAAWGHFLEARVNAAEVYREQYARERRWARRARADFSVFMSSSTDPFLPQERQFGVTGRILEAMHALPPDRLIVQTHSDAVTAYLPRYRSLNAVCDLRFHISIESDRDQLPGLPPPASGVDRRFHAAAALRGAGLRVVVTVSPLHPISNPEAFFRRIRDTADAVVIDHFIEGDGTRDGSRTARTALPTAMNELDATSVELAYRDRIVAIAREIMPGRVGVSREGFAGNFT